MGVGCSGSQSRAASPLRAEGRSHYRLIPRNCSAYDQGGPASWGPCSLCSPPLASSPPILTPPCSCCISQVLQPQGLCIYHPLTALPQKSTWLANEVSSPYQRGFPDQCSPQKMCSVFLILLFFMAFPTRGWYTWLFSVSSLSTVHSMGTRFFLFYSSLYPQNLEQCKWMYGHH